MVECLIKNGANIKVFDALKWSPLHLAVWNGDLKITELLLDNISEESETRSVLKSVTSKGSTPFKLAVTNGHAHILKLLIERGALNSQEEETQGLFVTAIKKGYLDVVKCLHKHGAKLETLYHHNHTALHYAVEDGHINIAKYLIDNGAAVDAITLKKERTPLHTAVIGKHSDVVEFLISNGANVDAKDAKDMTPLHLGMN